MSEFKTGKTIQVNGESFDIKDVKPCSAGIRYPGIKETFELTGTRESDPSFLAGKRTIFTAYLSQNPSGYSYDWAAK